MLIRRYFYCCPWNWIARCIDQPLQSYKVWPNLLSRKCNNGLRGSRTEEMISVTYSYHHNARLGQQFPIESYFLNVQKITYTENFPPGHSKINNSPKLKGSLRLHLVGFKKIGPWGPELIWYLATKNNKVQGTCAHWPWRNCSKAGRGGGG